MTKMHFIAFAAEIKRRYGLDQVWESHSIETRYAALDAIQLVCNVAHEFNPKFDETRFRRACGAPA